MILRSKERQHPLFWDSEELEIEAHAITTSHPRRKCTCNGISPVSSIALQSDAQHIRLAALSF